jgi:hypothetical protein
LEIANALGDYHAASVHERQGVVVKHVRFRKAEAEIAIGSGFEKLKGVRFWQKVLLNGEVMGYVGQIYKSETDKTKFFFDNSGQFVSQVSTGLE